MKPLRCAKCGLPWATIQNGVLMVESKHNGDKHTNVITLAELVKLLQEWQKSQNTEPEISENGTARTQESTQPHRPEYNKRL